MRRVGLYSHVASGQMGGLKIMNLITELQIKLLS